METKTATVKKLEKLVRDSGKISRTERHIRWNYEKSPSNPEMGIYHIVVVDDKNREATMGSIVYQIILHPFSESIDPIRTYQTGVKGSRLKVLLQSYESNMSPKNIDWSKVKKPVKFDENLRERIRPGYTIEKYVEKTYNPD